MVIIKTITTINNNSSSNNNNINDDDVANNKNSPSKIVENVSTLTFTYKNFININYMHAGKSLKCRTHNLNNSTRHQKHFRSTREHSIGRGCQPHNPNSYLSQIWCAINLLGYTILVTPTPSPNPPARGTEIIINKPMQRDLFQIWNLEKAHIYKVYIVTSSLHEFSSNESKFSKELIPDSSLNLFRSWSNSASLLEHKNTRITQLKQAELTLNWIQKSYE